MPATNSPKPIQKRRIALLKTMNKIPEAVAQLAGLLEVSPTDAESWMELSDLYLAQGMFDQSIFCLEEVLLILPGAWNVRCCRRTLLLATKFILDSSAPSRSDIHVVRIIWQPSSNHENHRRVHEEIPSKHRTM